MFEFHSEIAPAPVAGADHRSSPGSARSLLDGAPSVSAAEAALSRLLGRGVQLAVAGRALQWQMSPLAASEVAAPAHEHDWCLLDTPAGPLYLQDAVRFIAGLTGVEGGTSEAESPQWPQWMVGAVAGRLADTPLAGLRAIGRSAAPAPGAGLQHLQWRLLEPTHAITTQAVAGADTWCALLGTVDLIARRMPWSHWLPLVLDWPVVLATHRLPLALFDRLASGDLILPDNACFDSNGHGRVTLGQRRWQVAFVAPCHLQLLNQENPLQSDLIDDQVLEHDTEPYQDASTADDAASADANANAGADASMPGAVSLTLRFELGRTRLSLDQLRTLGPHSVLEVSDGTPHSLAISCGATQVGRGEVVDVDGRLGVRITHWDGAC